VDVVHDQDGTPDDDRGQLTDERIKHVIAAGPRQTGLRQEPGGLRCERRIVFPTRCHQVVEERHPVAVVVVEAVPERAHARSTREVGEQRRLAVARIGEDQDDPPVDLRAQPVEQARSFQRFVAERRTLDLRQLDGVAVDLVGQGAAPGHCQRWTGADGNGPALRLGSPLGLRTAQRRRSVVRGVNDRFGAGSGGHGRHGGLKRSSRD
jgi:hypothetical protein